MIIKISGIACLISSSVLYLVYDGNLYSYLLFIIGLILFYLSNKRSLNIKKNGNK